MAKKRELLDYFGWPRPSVGWLEVKGGMYVYHRWRSGGKKRSKYLGPLVLGPDSKGLLSAMRVIHHLAAQAAQEDDEEIRGQAEELLARLLRSSSSRGGPRAYARGAGGSPLGRRPPARCRACEPPAP